MYTDDVIITEANSIDLLKAAHKYEFEGLLTKCQHYLYRETNIDNSCSIYSWGRHLELSSLTEKTLDFIVENADDVFKTEGFLSLSNDDLYNLLSREDICAFEEEIITAAIQWANHQCKQNKIEINGQTMRQVLGPVLYTLRIPLLSLEKYSDIVVKSTILSEDEELGLYKYFTMSNKNHEDLCGFDKSQRNRLSLFVKAEQILKKKEVKNIQSDHYRGRFPVQRYSTNYNQRVDKFQKLSFLSHDSFFINAVTASLPVYSESDIPVSVELQISGSIPTRKIALHVNETTLIDINRDVKTDEDIGIFFCCLGKVNNENKKTDSSGWREIKIGCNKSVCIQIEGNCSIVSSIDISASKMK